MLRPATRDDLIAYFGPDAAGMTVWAIVADVDGDLIGIGGLAYRGGRVFAFCDLKDDARRYRKALHGCALATMQRAREAGHRFVYAEMNENEPTAERWLTRLGFERLGDDDRIWIWRD